jgi:F-type H+-transporting ATPase subunit epsilon
MLLEIFSPEKKLFSGEVQGVQLPGIGGLFEVLDKHAPLVSALSVGQVKVLHKSSPAETYSIKGGFVEVSNNKTTVLVEGVL